MKGKKRSRGSRVIPDVAMIPGEQVADTIRELGWSQAEVARRMGGPQPAIDQIVRGVKSITADTGLQLEAATGISAETWMNLQTNYDLSRARHSRKKPGRSQTIAPGAQ
jgi:addiction module HigA family antidote